jgi:hypothetical protein
MAVVRCNEVWESRTGRINYKFQRTYVRRFRVFVDDTTDGAVTVRLGVTSAYGITLGSAYPEDLYAWAKDIDVSQDSADPLIWYVTVNYDSVWEFDPADANENPLLRPEQRSVSYETQEKFVRYDLDDESILNSAGTPVNPPMSLQRTIQVLRIKQNRATVPATADAMNKVNNATWRGHAARTCLLRAPEVEEVWEGTSRYYAVTWVVAIRPDEPWTPTKVLDEGFYEWDAFYDEAQLIRDVYGNPASAPRLLDGNGALLDTEVDDPVYLEFRFHEEVNFTTLIG